MSVKSKDEAKKKEGGPKDADSSSSSATGKYFGVTLTI